MRGADQRPAARLHRQAQGLKESAGAHSPSGIDAGCSSAATSKRDGQASIRVSARKTPFSSKRPSRMAVASSVKLSGDRKSTRLNSSHVKISYAVFCLKKKKKETSSQ